MASEDRRTCRVLLYSHDGFGLGHLRRNLNVAGRLVHELPGSSALVLAGLPGIPGLQLPEGVDLVKLPSIRKVATETWEPRSLRVADDRLRAMRRELISATIESFDPDLVLIDYLPAGVWGELVEPLQALRAARPDVKVVLGLRDILDEPERTRGTWATAGHDAALARLYDRALVYGDPAVFDSVEAYGLGELLPGRVSYTGYLCAEERPGDRRLQRAKLGVADGQLLHLITAGGGADAFPMMNLALRAFRRRQAAGLREHVAVVTGPLMPREQVARLRRLARGLSATVMTTSSRLTTLMAASDLVITMAAYNTLTDALRLQVPILSIPREGPSAEQTMRAALFEKGKLLTRVSPAASSSEVAAAIDRALTQPRLVAPPPSLDGLEHAIDQLCSLLPAEGRRLRDSEDEPEPRGAEGHA